MDDSSTHPPRRGRSVTLELELPRPVELDRTRRVHVVVEDVAEADGRAKVLYETDVSPALTDEGTFAPIELDVPAIGGAVEPVIRVHVDEGATGTMTVGDFVNPGIVRLPDEPRSVVAVPMTELR